MCKRLGKYDDLSLAEHIIKLGPLFRIIFLFNCMNWNVAKLLNLPFQDGLNPICVVALMVALALAFRAPHLSQLIIGP